MPQFTRNVFENLKYQYKNLLLGDLFSLNNLVNFIRIRKFKKQLKSLDIIQNAMMTTTEFLNFYLTSLSE